MGAAYHGFCCVQSLAVARAREGDDYTLGKTDHRDSYLIGKLVIRPECYLPERAEEAWARLRHLGARRFAPVSEVVSGRQQIGDLLGCAWPAALAVAARPLESTTWLVALRTRGHPHGLGRIVFGQEGADPVADGLRCCSASVNRARCS